jgi:predicted TIM-barrel fold metal-dependent hydrolase
MRIDVHTHIFPPEIVQDRASHFKGESVFQLLYNAPKAKLATAEMLLEAMDKDGVDHAVVFGFPWQNTEAARRHNDYVLEAATRYATRLIPMGCVYPLGRDSLREAERCLLHGARGLGELAVYEACDTEEALIRFKELFACCRTHGAVMLVHANEPVGHSYPGKAPQGLDFYYSLARLAVGVPLILAHWGGGLCFYEMLKKEAPDVLAQIHYDTAASPFLYRPDIYARMTDILGKGRILFGSDYPLLTPGRYFKEMDGCGLGREEREAISGGNAARLFALKP